MVMMTTPLPPQPDPLISAQDMRTLITIAGISDDDLQLLVGYLHRRLTQCQLAEEHKMPQRTISDHLRSAVRKLNALGLRIVLPGRGRRRKPRLVAIDPESIGRMDTQQTDGLTSGRWIAIPKATTN